MLLRCVALFIPGLLLVFLTSEISQEKLKKKVRILIIAVHSLSVPRKICIQSVYI